MGSQGNQELIEVPKNYKAKNNMILSIIRNRSSSRRLLGIEKNCYIVIYGSQIKSRLFFFSIFVDVIFELFYF